MKCLSLFNSFLIYGVLLFLIVEGINKEIFILVQQLYFVAVLTYICFFSFLSQCKINTT